MRHCELAMNNRKNSSNALDEKWALGRVLLCGLAVGQTLVLSNCVLVRFSERNSRLRRWGLSLLFQACFQVRQPLPYIALQVAFYEMAGKGKRETKVERIKENDFCFIFIQFFKIPGAQE